jgi:hypothetical protein
VSRQARRDMRGVVVALPFASGCTFPQLVLEALTED